MKKKWSDGEVGIADIRVGGRTDTDLQPTWSDTTVRRDENKSGDKRREEMRNDDTAIIGMSSLS